MTTSVHEKETYAKFTLLDKFSDETESNNCLSFSDFLQRVVTRNFAIDGESVHYRSSQVSLTVRWYPFLPWMERGAEGSIVIHLTWPSPTHSSLPPSLHFVRFPEPISPLERRQTLWKIACFVQEHKPMKQPGLESSFSIGESKQSLEG